MEIRRIDAPNFRLLAPKGLWSLGLLSVLLLVANCASAPTTTETTTPKPEVTPTEPSTTRSITTKSATAKSATTESVTTTETHVHHSESLDSVPEQDEHTGYDGYPQADDEDPDLAVTCTLRAYDDICPPPYEGGAWEGVVPAKGSAALYNILGMQTVHSMLLPSGRLLLISGSSWRNRSELTEYFPEFPDPETPTGLFNRENDPFRNDKLDEYYDLVNNAAIYDPEANTFYRIPVPVPEPDPDAEDQFVPNDFFCTGHQHLSDGNILFTGGTQYYSPYRTGNNTSYIFDWRRELEIPWRKVDWRKRPKSNEKGPWTFSGFMKRGRWYPSLLPLLDGRQAIFSGFVGFDEGFPEMYVFEINSWVEVFDPQSFDPAAPEKAWKAVNVAKVENSPFQTLINPDFEPTPGVECDERCLEANKFDAFKLYPENYLMPDGRIYLTREGDWVSLRTCDTAFMRRTKKTYWATLEDDGDDLRVSFEHGPDRPEDITSYGTTFQDPRTRQIYLLGGQPTSPGTLFPLNARHPTLFAGGRGSRRLEVFTQDDNHPKGGHWTLDPHYLGDNVGDDRTMHYTVALPTGQILVINGGNYDFYGPVFHPILLNPEVDENGDPAGYSQKRILDALEPRLYHNAALLLTDGRVFVSGGNTSRASVKPRTSPLKPAPKKGQPKPDLDQVEVDLYFYDDGPMAKALPGQLVSPTENWTAEIFSPPYLFIDPDRRATITSLEPTEPVGYTPSTEIGGKTYTLFHSEVTYEMGLDQLPECPGEDARLSLIKLPNATHGWQNGQMFVELNFEPTDGGVRFTTPNAHKSLIPPAFYMLFYTDCRGKPSEAWMVRFDDNALAP